MTSPKNNAKVASKNTAKIAPKPAAAKKPTVPTTPKAPETTAVTPIVPPVVPVKEPQKVTITKGENPTNKVPMTERQERKAAKKAEMLTIMEELKPIITQEIEKILETTDKDGNKVPGNLNPGFETMKKALLGKANLLERAKKLYAERHPKAAKGEPKRTPAKKFTRKIAKLIHAALESGMEKDVIGSCLKEAFANPMPSLKYNRGAKGSAENKSE